jgi:hypothetical protein
MCFAMNTLKRRLLWSPTRLCSLLTNSRTVALSRLDHERFLPCPIYYSPLISSKMHFSSYFELCETTKAITLFIELQCM